MKKGSFGALKTIWRKMSLTQILGAISHIWRGLIFVAILTLASFLLARTELIASLHLSSLIIGVLLGMLCSPLFGAFKANLSDGVAFSAKRLLRLGIILFGFGISFSGMLNIGVNGVLLALVIVCSIFLLGILLGTKVFKIDTQSAMLVGVGSAVCGAAAVLALEGVLRSESSKGVLAVASVVVFGLLGMFLFPILINSGIIPLLDSQKGLFLGAALHEVANVVGASGAIISPYAHEIQESAIIVKMIRVLLLVPLLLIVAFFISKNNPSKSIYIPWFAIFFLLAIVLNSCLRIPDSILFVCKIVAQIFLTSAMIALGLQINIRTMREMGARVFGLGLALFVFLATIAFLLIHM